MQQYNIFQAMYLSFYSKKLYRDVASNWGGKTFLYLLMLLALTLIYYAYSIQREVIIGYHAIHSKISPQIPVITIDNGNIITPENKPYVIADPESKSTFAIIDTSGKYTSIEQANSVLLITKTEIISKTKPNEVRIYKVPATFKQTLDPKIIHGYIEKGLGYAWILFYLVALLVLYIYRVLQALLYSIIGKLFALIFRVPVSYGQIVQIMMVAITPVIILSMILHILEMTISHEALLFFLLAMVYLFYGILANKDKQ